MVEFPLQNELWSCPYIHLQGPLPADSLSFTQPVSDHKLFAFSCVLACHHVDECFLFPYLAMPLAYQYKARIAPPKLLDPVRTEALAYLNKVYDSTHAHLHPLVCFDGDIIDPICSFIDHKNFNISFQLLPLFFFCDFHYEINSVGCEVRLRSWTFPWHNFAANRMTQTSLTICVLILIGTLS